MSITQQSDPFENAIAERINGIRKYEFGLRRTIATIDIARNMIKEAVAIYNNDRLHWSLDLKTPHHVHDGYNQQKYKSYKRITAWLSTFKLFMWGCKQALLRSNLNSAKKHERTKNEVGGILFPTL